MAVSGKTADLSTRERQRLDTHQRIYAVAEAEIRRHGLAGLSVAAIAKAAGVSRQTFYDHFPTLDAIVGEALAGYRARVANLLDSQQLASAPLDEVLDGVIDALFSAMDRDNGRMRQEISAYLTRGVHVGSWLEEPLFQLVVSAVERAQTTGQVDQHHDPSATARLLLTALSGFLHIETEAPDLRSARARDAARLLTIGLRVAPTGATKGSA